jgi:hypothetical protein
MMATNPTSMPELPNKLYELAYATEHYRKCSVFHTANNNNRKIPMSEIKQQVQAWLQLREGILILQSRITYLEMKSVAHQKNSDRFVPTPGAEAKFPLIPSTPQHIEIRDSSGVVLVYKMRLDDPNQELLTSLSNSVALLPHAPPEGSDGKRADGEATTRHYGSWVTYRNHGINKDVAVPKEIRPTLTAEHKLDKADDFKASIQPLADQISGYLRFINPQAWIQYRSVCENLPRLAPPLTNTYHACAVNRGDTDAVEGTLTHIDWGDSHGGLNAVVPFAEPGKDWTGGNLIMWQLEVIIEMRPGDLIFFNGGTIAHNTTPYEGQRNSINFFTHRKVIEWVRRMKLGHYQRDN